MVTASRVGVSGAAGAVAVAVGAAVCAMLAPIRPRVTIAAGAEVHRR
jgi:hypothetical protein